MTPDCTFRTGSKAHPTPCHPEPSGSDKGVTAQSKDPCIWIFASERRKHPPSTTRFATVILSEAEGEKRPRRSRRTPLPFTPARPCQGILATDADTFTRRTLKSRRQVSGHDFAGVPARRFAGWGGVSRAASTPEDLGFSPCGSKSKSRNEFLPNIFARPASHPLSTAVRFLHHSLPTVILSEAEGEKRPRRSRRTPSPFPLARPSQGVLATNANTTAVTQLLNL
jgi:hypothetical protein